MAELAIGTAGRGRDVRVLGDLLAGSVVRDLTLVAGGAVLVGAAAQLSMPVPGSPVPITGQTFAVLLCGAALGTRRGVGSLLLYVAAGMAGVPWFADGSSGVPTATFGYLLGFILAVGIVGRLAAGGADRRVGRTVGMMVAGTAVVYLIGVPWLAAALGGDLVEAARLGLVPYLPGDALKVLLAAGMLPGAWRLVDRFAGPHHRSSGT